MPGEPNQLQLETQIEEYAATSGDAMIQQIAENDTPSMHFMPPNKIKEPLLFINCLKSMKQPHKASGYALFPRFASTWCRRASM